MARLRFGGESLPKGSLTWYDHTNPDGSSGGQLFVRPGDEVDAARVVDAQGYVDRGQAQLIPEEGS
jgi:hypothetical protein